MNPRNAGGILAATTTASPLGLRPQPPSFPHQNAQPGVAPSRPGPLPATSAYPQGGPVQKPQYSEGVAISNELVVLTAQAKKWNSGYDKSQRPGDLLFVQRDPRVDKGAFGMVNLSQLAEMSREHHRRLEALHASNQGGNKNDQKIREMYSEYKKDGEMYFTSNRKDIFKRIRDDSMLFLLRFISKENFVDEWNKFGLYSQDSGRNHYDKHLGIINKMGGTGALILNIGVKGPTSTQEMFNYWGDVKQDEHLFLIWTRRLDTSLSTQDEPVYGPFEWETWHGFDSMPPISLTYYKDDAGVSQNGIAYHIGIVHETPYITPSTDTINALIGRGYTSAESFGKSAGAPTVAVSLGTPRHKIGCCYY